jgi:nitric-oxide synthase
MNHCPYRPVLLNQRPPDRESLASEVQLWLEQFYAENALGDTFFPRRAEVLKEIERTGTYQQRPEELTYGAKVAWRNSVRCVGRMPWKSLIVRDCRHLQAAEEVFAALVEHLRITTNGGAILPVITVFAPAAPGQGSIRIWNHQLAGYAGYRQPDGTTVGDPLNLEFTGQAQRLGWRARTREPFDLLPLVIQMPGEAPQWFELPPGTVLQIPLRHPEFAWVEDLRLRWYATPVISDMRLEVGGLSYPAAPFGGWYVGSEIGARDLADVNRYNLLPMIAKGMKLDTASDRTLWKDRALVELNRAVLFSFESAGVRMVDHHAVTRQFMSHQGLEAQEGRATYADWSWVVPPISGATTPVFHRLFENRVLKPNFFYQIPAWQERTA